MRAALVAIDRDETSDVLVSRIISLPSDLVVAVGIFAVVADSFSVIKTISQDNHGRENLMTNQGSPCSALIVVALGTTIAAAVSIKVK